MSERRMEGTDADGRRQNYITPTLSGGKKGKFRIKKSCFSNLVLIHLLTIALY